MLVIYFLYNLILNSKKKILIIYSSIWKGHISAAEAISDEIIKIRSE